MKKLRFKKVIALATSFAMLLGIVVISPTNVKASGYEAFDIGLGSITIDAGTNKGLKVTCGTAKLVDNIPIDEEIIITGGSTAPTDKNIIINTKASFTLDICTINENSGSAIVVNSGDTTINLVGKSDLTGASGNPTLYVKSGTVTIVGSGTLNANGGGGVDRGIYGTTTINDGTVNVTGYYGINGTTTINGGTVNATGTGRGYGGIYGTTTINGGTVNATGTGGGSAGICGATTITGGTVNVTGVYSSINCIGGDLVITGGSMNAKKLINLLHSQPISGGSSPKTLVLKKLTSLTASAQVDALGITDNLIVYKPYGTSKTNTYGAKDIYADDSGNVYLWLPSASDNVIVKQGSTYTETKSGGAEVSFTSPTYVYGDANPSLPSNNDIEFAFQDSTFLPKMSDNSNIIPLDITFSGDKNVALSDSIPITVKPKDITAKNLMVIKVYDGTTAVTNDQIHCSFIGLIGSDKVTLTADPALAFETKDVGESKKIKYNGTFALGGADCGNYNLAQQPTGLTGEITKSSYPLLPATKTIGVLANLPTATKCTYDVSSLLTKKDGGNVTYTTSSAILLSGNVVSTTTPPALGLNDGLLTFYANPNVASGTDTLEINAQSDNYDDSKVILSFESTTAKKVDIIVPTQDKTYDGKPVSAPTVDVKDSSTKDSVSTNYPLIYTYVGAKYGPTTNPPINAGNYTLTVETDPREIYFGSSLTNFKITKASSLEVTADDITVKKGDPMPTFTYKTTGFVNNETSAFSTFPIAKCFQKDTNTIGTYPIDFNEGVSLNYDPTYVSGTFTVTSVPTYELTTNATTGGTVSSGGKYASGDKVTLTATEESGYQFSNWTSSNGGSFSDANSLSTTFTMPANACEVTANFTKKAPQTYILTTNANPSTGGTVSSGGSYASGDPVTLTATEASGYQFSNWTSSNGGSFANANSLSTTFTMPANACEVTANFRKKGTQTYILTTNANPTTGGTVSIGGSYASGDPVTLTATEESGYQFSNWTSSNGGSFANANSLSTTFTMPANACEVTANFTKKGSYVPSSGGGGGGGYSSPSIPSDSEAVIDTKIANATKGLDIDLSTGTKVALFVKAEQMKKINDNQSNLVISGEKVSLKIPTDSGILTSPDDTNVYIPPIPVQKVTSTHFNGIDAKNIQLLENTLTRFSVTSGDKIVDSNATITFKLSTLGFSDDQISKLACAKIDSKGNYTVLAGKYDKDAKTFTVPVESLGAYGVVINDIPVTVGTKKTHVVLTIGKTDFTANGKSSTMDTAPIIKNGTTYVPLRFISESLGAKIDWNGDTRTATISLDGKTIKIVSGDNNFIKDNRMMVTLRYISENLGATVNWDVSTKTIEITKN